MKAVLEGLLFVVGEDGLTIDQIMDILDINEAKNKHKVREQMTLKVNRDGKEKEIILTLQEQ